MRNTKNSKEVQGTRTAQEQMLIEFNLATKKLFFNFGYEFIKPTYELLIYSWIASDNLHLYNQRERANLYFFNKEFLDFLGKLTPDAKEVNLFLDFIDYFDYKTAEERLYEVYDSFLNNEESSDLTTRQDSIMLFKELTKYLKKIYKIYENKRNEMKISA